MREGAARVTVTHLGTGEVIQRLGPYPDARAARVAAGEHAGQALTWTREAETWQAERDPLAYHVPANPPKPIG